MNLNDAQSLAVAKLHEHGLTPEWGFKFDRAAQRAGQCRYRDRTITLSRFYVENNDEAEVTDTILHEIAHALVGGGHGHDYTWKRKCLEIGGNARRTTHGQSNVPYKWEGTCPNGHVVGRRRLTQSVRDGATCNSCSNTYDPQFKLSWRKAE